MAQPQLREETIEIDCGGRKMPVFIACAEAGGKQPAVIIVHEIFGLNDHIRDVARRFARLGIVAYAVDLFEGAPDLPADRNDLNGMRTVWSNIPDSTLIADLQLVLELAQTNDAVAQNRIGTIGFCMGGAIAYMFACSSPSISWVVDFYGRIFYPQLSEKKPKHPIDYTQLSCPVLAFFAGQDNLITSEHVEAFKTRLAESGTIHEVDVYDKAKHAFFNDQREFYDLQAATDAWQRTVEFIAKHARRAVI